MRTTTAAALVVAFSALTFPAIAEAQNRRAVPRAVQARPAVRAGVYYAPRVYRGWYARPYYYGYPYYFGFYGAYGYPGYYGPWYPPYYYGGAYAASASLRLQVTPREAEVFVDGYYAGTVDDFDGVFQRLHLEPGDHDVEVYLPGHRSIQQKVYLQPGKTFNIRQAMEPLAAGDPEPVRPSGSTALPERPRAGDPRGVPPIRPRDRDRDRGVNGEPSEETRAEFGALSLRVQPGDASVSVDGEVWEGSGDNERLIVQLGAGVHTVEIQKDGYRTYITDVTIRPGDTTTLNVALTRQ